MHLTRRFFFFSVSSISYFTGFFAKFLGYYVVSFIAFFLIQIFSFPSNIIELSFRMKDFNFESYNQYLIEKRQRKFSKSSSDLLVINEVMNWMNE